MPKSPVLMSSPGYRCGAGCTRMSERAHKAGGEKADQREEALESDSLSVPRPPNRTQTWSPRDQAQPFPFWEPPQHASSCRGFLRRGVGGGRPSLG